MKKILLYGIVSHGIIALISLYLNDIEIIKKGSIILILSALVIGSWIGTGAGGWEYVGLKKNE